MVMIKLIVFECRKHFLKRSILLVLILFCLIDVIKIGSVYNEKSLLSKRFSPPFERIYWQQYADFSGEISLAKINQLLEIYKPLEKQTADLTASTATDNPNTFTGNIYSDYYFFRDCFVRPMEYSYLYEGNANAIVLAAEENLNFFVERGNSYEYNKNALIAKLYAGRKISSFAYTEMYQYFLQFDFSTLLCLLLCLYGLVNVFILEKETDMETLLLTTRGGGKKTVLAKILASMLFIIAVCSLFWLVDFGAFAAFFGSLEGSFSPLYALQNFEYASANINLLQYSLLSAAIKTGGMLTLGMGFLAVSCLFKNALFPFIANLIASALLIFASAVNMGSGHIFIKTVNPFLLFANHELFRKTEFLNLFGMPLLSSIAALLFAFFWSAIFIVAIFYLSKANTNFHTKSNCHSEGTAACVERSGHSYDTNLSV